MALDECLHEVPVGDVFGIGALDADRLRLALGVDRAVIDGTGEQEERAAVGLPEQTDELVLAALLEFGNGVHADAPQSFGGGRTDPWQHRHLHRTQHRLFGAWRHQHQSVGLLQVTGHLGNELRRADPDAGSQAAGGLLDAGTQLLPEPPEPGQVGRVDVARLEVDEGLVDGEWLDEGEIARSRSMTTLLAAR